MSLLVDNPIINSPFEEPARYWAYEGGQPDVRVGKHKGGTYVAGPQGMDIYDPCCGPSGVSVQSVEFIEAHATGNGGRDRAQISMNLAIRGIDGRIEQGDTFHDDCFPNLKADYILANPPFNMKEWGGERLRGDKRWKFGVPHRRHTNFAWVQHIIHHLAPTGYAGFVLANGSTSSSQSGEGEIRKNVVETDLVDCMVALPDKLFNSTQIPACLWFLARNRSAARRAEKTLARPPRSSSFR